MQAKSSGSQHVASLEAEVQDLQRYIEELQKSHQQEMDKLHVQLQILATEKAELDQCLQQVQAQEVDRLN